MKVNPQFRFFKEPYTNEERYWLVNIEEGNVYKINKETFECLQSIERNKEMKSKNIISELKKLGAINEN